MPPDNAPVPDDAATLLRSVTEIDWGAQWSTPAEAPTALAELADLVVDSEEACSVIVSKNGVRPILQLVRGGNTEAASLAVDILVSIGLSETDSNRAAVSSALDSQLNMDSTNREWAAVALIAFALAGGIGLVASAAVSVTPASYDAPDWHGPLGLAILGIVAASVLLCWILLLKYKRAYRLACTANDRVVQALLDDGTVRLLSCEWLRTCPYPVLRRCQNLPEEAFLPPDVAARLYRRRDRSVAVLSYCWTDPRHPDMEARNLRKVKAFLRVATSYKGIFWDYCCLPQDDWIDDGPQGDDGLQGDDSTSATLAGQQLNASNANRRFSNVRRQFSNVPKKRTPEEDERFYRGICAMGHLYGSFHCTAVLQLKAEPNSGERQYETSGWCLFEQGTSQLIVGHATRMESIVRRLRHYFGLLGRGFACLRTLLLAVGSDALGAGSLYQQLEADATDAEVELRSHLELLSKPKLLDISAPEEPIVCNLSQPPTCSELRKTIDTVEFANSGGWFPVCAAEALATSGAGVVARGATTVARGASRVADA